MDTPQKPETKNTNTSDVSSVNAPNKPIVENIPSPDPTSLSASNSISTQVEIPKQKSSLIKIFLIIFGFFIILVLGMLGVKSIKTPVSSPSPVASLEEFPTEVPDQTADWSSYINKSLVFQIRVPKDWRAESNKEQANTVWLKAPDESIIEITATESADLSLGDYIRKVSDEAQIAWEGKPSKEFGDEIDTSVGDFTAKEIEVKYLSAGFTTTATYAKVEKMIFSFTVLPPASGDTVKNQSYENYSLILSTFKKYVPIDLSKWKEWADPNGFSLMYPPNAKIKHLNENTIVDVKSDSGAFSLSFCKDCVKDPCSGVCDKEKDIKVTVGEQKYQEKQISPDNNGNFTFRVVIPYPNTFIREKLAIFGYYPLEENLEEIQNILSTFKFTEKKKE